MEARGTQRKEKVAAKRQLLGMASFIFKKLSHRHDGDSFEKLLNVFFLSSLAL